MLPRTRNLWRATLIACLAPLLLPALAHAQSLRVSTDKAILAAGSGPISVSIDLADRGAVVARVYDAQGNFIRLLAGQHASEARLQVPWDLKDSTGKAVGPGDYNIKVQAGLHLTLDRAFGKSGILNEPAATNPWRVRVNKQGDIFLFDKGTSTVFKYKSDCSPANDWSGKNSFSASAPAFWGDMAVDDADGRIFLSETFTTSHVIDVYDGKSATALKPIGGYFGDDQEWKKEKGGIAYPFALALGGNHRLYSDSPGYGTFFAFDRTKEGKAAGVWIMGYDKPSHAGWSSAGEALESDGRNAIYFAAASYNNRAPIFKCTDAGDTCKFVCALSKFPDPGTAKDEMIDDVMALGSDGQGLLFAVERAHSRLLLLSDSGPALDFAAAWGGRGKEPARMEFTGLHSVTVGPDGATLYLVEDGDPMGKTDSAVGNTRVSRFKIRWDNEKSARVNLH